ncbi:MAG: cytochrome-c oxidase, cbb3-type subunit I [Helicobacter sp.]|nr:cytochrome-c oxidase, cbb3-type subunit I [Helicobacter sp.]
MQKQKLEYDYSIAKLFLFTMLIFGFIAMLIGVILALQLAFPSLNYIASEYGIFGRLRQLHTNGVIYGFTLSGIWTTWYYLGQRVLKITYHDHKFLKVVGLVHFWLYVVILIIAVISLFAGLSQAKEYAELEWPVDILIVIAWVLWGLNLFGSMHVRREKTLYISLWYYIATFAAISVLFIFNNLAIPTYLVTGLGSIWHSIPIYAGSNDAMVQWWWGHNAVAFVFTAGIIAIIYYFLPKESGQPVYSYKLTLFSFWSLMFVYIWAGGHHLIYATIPDWVQTLGSIFSVILILPSWGSSVNLLLTMKGQWHQVKDSPLIKFMVLAATFYMLATFEGSIQSIRSVNALAHFTDWTIGHVHDGALGWVAFVIISAGYHMVPRMFKREIYSKKIMEFQFWIMVSGIVLYFSSMWIGGVLQGMMWRDVDEYGNLAYQFIDTVVMLHPYYVVRGLAGVLYLTGFILYMYNIFMTISVARKLESEPSYSTPMSLDPKLGVAHV